LISATAGGIIVVVVDDGSWRFLVENIRRRESGGGEGRLEGFSGGVVSEFLKNSWRDHTGGHQPVKEIINVYDILSRVKCMNIIIYIKLSLISDVGDDLLVR